MAASSSSASLSKSQTALDPFNKFKIKIGLELTRVDVRVLKSAFVGSIPNTILNEIEPKDEGAGLDLLNWLQQFGFFSSNNLSLVKEGLLTGNRVDLAERVEEFGKTVTEVRNVPLSLMDKLPGPTSFLLHLLLTGQRNSIGSSRIEILKESLGDKLGIKVSEVPFIQMTELNQDCTFVILQFPQRDDKVDQLILAAVNKAEWLVNLGVLQLKINGKAPISIDENVLEVRQVPPRETRRLVMNPAFLGHHSDNALDLILVFEIPFTVTPHILKQMLEHCQSATHALKRCFDMRLAIVTYGNHFPHQLTKQTAFLRQEFSTRFEFTSHVKNEGQCGGEGGSSGLADALARVKELTTGGNVRREATKLCVFINFLVEELKDLECYRCSHGNDAIKLCGNLAENGVALYIFGVEVPLPQQENGRKKDKNFFLEGIAHIGGGRYFQLENVGHLNEAIADVTKHDVSIEKHGKFTGEIVKEDIVTNHEVICYNSLPKKIEQNLTLNGCTVDALKENGRSLEPVSKLAQKVSLSNDLDEAIEIVGPILSKQDSRSRSCKGRSQALVAGMEGGETSGMLKSKPLLGKKRKVVHEKCSVSLMEKQAVDWECAVRIMKRQLHRLAYFEIPDPQDQEMMSVDE